MLFRDLGTQYLRLKEEIDANIKATIETGRFISGPFVKQLEGELAEYAGVAHCVTCGNGTDALEQLLNPLRKIRVPVHEFSMMMTIALRFIPTLIDETQKIINAQTARGADFTTGSLLRRGRALIPILIPLFISAFRRADELATAMECRCYTGGEGRTRMNTLKSEPKDWAFLGAIFAMGAAVVCLNLFFPVAAVQL